jgi:hypothetical protein
MSQERGGSLPIATSLPSWLVGPRHRWWACPARPKSVAKELAECDGWLWSALEAFRVRGMRLVGPVLILV